MDELLHGLLRALHDLPEAADLDASTPRTNSEASVSKGRAQA
jgi:hypothetical protein